MYSTLPLLAIFTVPLFVANVAAECTQFVTNGSTAAKYDYYRFYDFRNLQESQDGRPISESSDGHSKTFSAIPWNVGWTRRDWFRPAYREDMIDMQYTPSEFFISNNTETSEEPLTYVTLHTRRLPNGTQLAAELDYAEYNVTHASIRMSARVRGASGAVAALFTYHDDTNESDIEILTRDASNEVHFSNQPTTDPNTDAPIAGSTFAIPLADAQSISTWNDYRLDWIQGRSAWYANGAPSAHTAVNVPNAESMVILNMWSNGGSFSGRMELGEEAWFDVQWIELLFNVTSNADYPKERTLCSAENSLGSPTPVVESGASGL